VSLRKGITRLDEAPKKAGKPGLWGLKAAPNLSKLGFVSIFEVLKEISRKVDGACICILNCHRACIKPSPIFSLAFHLILLNVFNRFSWFRWTPEIAAMNQPS